MVKYEWSLTTFDHKKMHEKLSLRWASFSFLKKERFNICENWI